MTTRTCTNCGGSGRVEDTRYASISHRPQVIRRKCGHCLGAGEITVRRPEDVIRERREAAQDVGEIPDWMLLGY